MAGWTDYCPDWSSKDKLRLCSVYDALSALTAAVNERGSVLGSYTPLPAVNRLYPVKYYVDLIDAEIKSIVPQFVNHTVNDGDFSGLDAIPMWTWDDTLDGEDEVSINRLYPVLDWVYQRYEITNRLRWIAPSPSFIVNINNNRGKIVFSIQNEYGNYSYIIQVIPANWSSLIAAFNSAELKNIGWVLDGHISYRVNAGLISEDSGYYTLFNTGQSQIRYPQHELKFLLDSYVYPYGIDDSIFQPLPSVPLNNKLNKTLSFDESYSNDYFYSLDFSEFSPEGKTPPPLTYYQSTKRFQGTPFMILKFTGSNGFQFKDW